MFYWDYSPMGQMFSPERQIRRRQRRAEAHARTAHAEDMQDMKLNIPGYWRHYGPHPWRTAAYGALGMATASFIIGGIYYNYEESQRYGASLHQAVEQVLGSSQYLAKLGICGPELTAEAVRPGSGDIYRQAARRATEAHLGCASLNAVAFVDVALPGGDEMAVYQRDVIPTVYAEGGLNG